MLASILRIQPRRVLSATCRANVLLVPQRSLSLATARPVLSRPPVLSSTTFLRSYREVAGDQEPKPKLFVRNLPYDADENDLQRVFSEFGNVQSTHILRGGDHISGSRAAGFVEFEDVSSATRALESGVQMSGRTIQINYSQSNKKTPRRPKREPRMDYFEEVERSDTLFIHKLPYRTTETDLELIFSDFGTIREIVLPRHEHGNKGYAFIKFESEDSAMAARRSGQEEPFYLFGQDLVVRLNKSKTGKQNEASQTPTPILFIGKLAYAADDADVQQFFSKFGQVKGVRIGRRHDGASRGFGFVTFESVEDAKKAFDAREANPEDFVISGHQVTLEYSGKKNIKVEAKEPSNTLWIGNVPFDATPESLTDVLSPFGSLQDIHILKDRDGAPRGVAFVSFVNLEDATAAYKSIVESGLVIKGRKIQVDYSTRGNSTSNTIEIRSPNRIIDKQWKELFGGIEIVRKAAVGPRDGSEEYVFYATFDSVETAEKAMQTATENKDDSMRLNFGRNRDDV